MDVLCYLDTVRQNGTFSFQWELAYQPKKFLSSGFTSSLCSPLNVCSSVSPAVPQTSHYNDVLNLFCQLEESFEESMKLKH